MQIRLEATGVDPRIFDVLIDFTGYEDVDCYYFQQWGRLLIRRDNEVRPQRLDEFLTAVKLRRISYWSAERSWPKRSNIYRTTVISDREQ